MSRSAFVLGVVACGLALPCACHRDADENLGIQGDDAPRVRLDALTDPHALLTALRQPGSAVDRKLGGRGFDLKRGLELGSGAGRDVVVQAFHFDADGSGGFHLVNDIDHPEAMAPVAVREDAPKTAPVDQVDTRAQGMEAVALGGSLYTRPRYGHFVERAPEPGELDRLRALAERVVGDDVELLVPFMKVNDRGEGNVLGRRTRKLSLSLRAGARGEKTDDPARAWRAQMSVSALTGELELDAETGFPLAARIDTTYRIPRTGGAVDVRLALREDPRPAQPIAAPDAVPTPARAHPVVERNQLLEGLAPPSGTQAARAP